MPRRAFIQSFGCRASQADGAAIEESLRQAGYEIVSDAATADLAVVNTCTVTHAADVDARRTVRGIHRRSPATQIAVTGCYAQRAPEEIAAIKGVRWVIGNSHKAELASIVGAATQTSSEDFHGQIIRSGFDRSTPFSASPVRDIRGDRTRPNLKVQDGCNNRCSFCIIPGVRGSSRSAPAASVIAQLQDLAARYREVVLTGINLGRWGRDFEPRQTFVSLLRQALAETPIGRLRISSVEPMDWSDELIRLMAGHPRIAQHVHMPLQSGSDGVLKRMSRRYRTRHYSDRLCKAWREMPDAAFGADVMTGFPGETDSEFAETVRFIEDQPFTYLHVFTYSERPDTAAARRSSQVPMDVRRARTEVLRRLSAAKTREFERRMLGKTFSAITLEEPGVALTTNYLRIRLTEPALPNRLIDITPGAFDESGLKQVLLFPVLA